MLSNADYIIAMQEMVHTFCTRVVDSLAPIIEIKAMGIHLKGSKTRTYLHQLPQRTEVNSFIVAAWTWRRWRERRCNLIFANSCMLCSFTHPFIYNPSEDTNVSVLGSSSNSENPKTSRNLRFFSSTKSCILYNFRCPSTHYLSKYINVSILGSS